MTETSDFWDKRRVLLTGHTGFKGSWLSAWLTSRGAVVSGLSLDPPTQPSLYESAGISSLLANDRRGDIRDLPFVTDSLLQAAPQVVFHLAAQPLVFDSYRDPITTFSTNVMGTANLLEAVRKTPSVRSVVVITTDKVYENREWPWGYRESDTLGGSDPYAASKAASELVVASYRQSFFRDGVGVASARAGNVIGGGDFSADRIIPDAVRAFVAKRSVRSRRPRSIRPWQHVLEPLAGYLKLAEHLYGAPTQYASAWNFGPPDDACIPVSELLNHTCRAWGSDASWESADDEATFHETTLLRLDSAQAQQRLRWKSRWSVETCIAQTVGWYRSWADGADHAALLGLMRSQIRAYEEAV